LQGFYAHFSIDKTKKKLNGMGFVCKARFTEALMHNMAKIPIRSEHIFSTTVSGQPKSDILKELQQQHPGASCHFVEDKLGTLEKVRPSTQQRPLNKAVMTCCFSNKRGTQCRGYVVKTRAPKYLGVVSTVMQSVLIE